MATNNRGIITTVTDTTNIKYDISEAIDFLSPTDVPILDLVGRDSLHTPCTQVKHEWLEDELRGRQGTLLSAYTAGSGTMTLNTSEGKYLYPDDLILIANVVYRVTSGPPDSDTILVTVEGGTDASAAAAAVWRKISHAAQEGGSARADATKVAIARPYNYTQILKDWCMITGTMKVIDRYGYASEWEYQMEKILRMQAIDLEHLILYGVRAYTEGPPRKSSAGGLFNYVLLDGITDSWDTVYNAADGDLTESMLNTVLQAMWEAGGKPDFVLVNGTNKRRFTDWASPRIRTVQGERKAGAAIYTYESDFGTIDIVLDRWLRSTDVILGARGSWGIGPLTGRAFSSRMLPSTGDYDWWEILGEYTMEVHKPKIDFGWIYNTSSAY
jgi:hypothetical protein